MTCSACDAGWASPTCPLCGKSEYARQREPKGVLPLLVGVPDLPPVPTRPGLRVVAAATRVRLTPGETGDPRAVTVTISAPPPARHHNLFAVGEHLWPAKTEDSGFLLSDGSYADRIRAAAVAIAAGQIRALAHPPYLYSEDLW